VETCIVPPAELAVEVEGWAHRATGKMPMKAIDKAIRKTADLFIIINQLVR
jgi:hypothetical protein